MGGRSTKLTVHDSVISSVGWRAYAGDTITSQTGARRQANRRLRIYLSYLHALLLRHNAIASLPCALRIRASLQKPLQQKPFAGNDALVHCLILHFLFRHSLGGSLTPRFLWKIIAFFFLGVFRVPLVSRNTSMLRKRVQ